MRKRKEKKLGNYEILLKHLNEKYGLNTGEILNEIFQYFDQPKRGLEEFFNKKSASSSLSSKAQHNQLAQIRQLYLGFNINPDVFSIKPPYKGIITPYSPKLSSLEKFQYLYTRRGEDKEDAEKEYSEALSPYIKGAKEEILIYDYMSKGERYILDNITENIDPSNPPLSRVIYDLYEDRLHEKVKYSRLWAMPFPKTTVINKKNKLLHTSMALLFCSSAIFEHFCRCFWIDRLNSQKNFTLKLVFVPTRLYHFGTIDDRFAISEYYRYDFKGNFEPDLLFIERVSKNKKTSLFKIYKDEMEELINKDTKAFKITEELLSAGLLDALSFAKIEYQKAQIKDDVIYNRLVSVRKKITIFNENFPDLAIDIGQ